ncbi:glycine zipper domain-containing protein [Geomonas sp. RF6]|uniref:glycine zipper family protein n=1 Tax=Geomonas sp. RF6 TaxID=2897342 RepID=UPI001E580EDF|nr:glycine zipper family protein [Geomonas sp. RF6]UFS70661.1 glycine zipper domain-containing protein [Geomonas sp. RF6]
MNKKRSNRHMLLPALRLLVVPAVAAAVLAGSVAEAAEPYVYPKQGQSKDQMEKDKYSCYQWAKGESGFDPMKAPTATAAAPTKKGGAVRGAAGGAALGAAVGAIAGDAGKGAAIGAASGGIVGGVRKRRSESEQEAYQQQQSASYDKGRGEYDRAWSACLEGKGYTVK